MKMMFNGFCIEGEAHRARSREQGQETHRFAFPVSDNRAKSTSIASRESNQAAVDMDNNATHTHTPHTHGDNEVHSHTHTHTLTHTHTHLSFDDLRVASVLPLHLEEREAFRNGSSDASSVKTRRPGGRHGMARASGGRSAVTTYNTRVQSGLLLRRTFVGGTCITRPSDRSTCDAAIIFGQGTRRNKEETRVSTPGMSWADRAGCHPSPVQLTVELSTCTHTPRRPKKRARSTYTTQEQTTTVLARVIAPPCRACQLRISQHLGGCEHRLTPLQAPLYLKVTVF